MTGKTQSIDRGTTSPKHTLEEAVGMLHTIESSYGTNGVSRDLVAEAFGNSAKSSAAGIKIGSLTHFGLLQRNGNVYKISELGIQIIKPSSDRERELALVDAAKKPGLYRRLFTDYAEKGLPSMLENILQRTYGVAQGNAAEVVKNFQATADYAGLYRNGVLYLDIEDADTVQNDQVESIKIPSVPHLNPNYGREVSRSTDLDRTSIISHSDSFDIPLSKGKTATLVIARPVLASDVDRLSQWIDLMRDVLIEQSEDTEKPETT